MVYRIIVLASVGLAQARPNYCFDNSVTSNITPTVTRVNNSREEKYLTSVNRVHRSSRAFPYSFINSLDRITYIKFNRYLEVKPTLQ